MYEMHVNLVDIFSRPVYQTWAVSVYVPRDLSTLRSQIEGYTRLLIFRKFSTLPAVIWASPFINFQENFQPPCFFTYTNEKFSTLPAVIRASPLIKFEEKF